MLRAGGLLVTCSCSFHVSPTDFLQMLAGAARDAHRIAQTPLGRLGTVDDMARAITFLLSDESLYISGHTLSVDGGISTSFL